MTHAAQREFIARVRGAFPHIFKGRRVLEVGSLNINGSVRSQFEDCDYLGLDIGAGPGVDLVCAGQDYDAPDASFDVVLSCECMEHNPFWRETFLNMARMTKPGGVVVMTCATTGRDEHGTTRSHPDWSPLTVEQGWDYYRNLVAGDFRRSIDMGRLFVAHVFCTNVTSSDLYFMGVRAGAPTDVGARETLAAFELAYARANLSRPRQLLDYLLMRAVGEGRVRAVRAALARLADRGAARHRVLDRS